MNKYILFILFLVVLVSCRKDEDVDYPEVNILSPGNLTTHYVLQPITFKVTASDETHLESITVYLLNDSYASVTSPVTMYCDENSETFESQITPNDIHLPGGTYYIKAVADDGHNQQVKYCQINLIEIPRTLKKAIVVTSPGGNSISLDSLNGSIPVNFHSVNSDFSAFAADSWNQTFIFAGSLTGNLTVQDATFFNNYFSIPNTGSGSNSFFTFLHTQPDESKFFVADRSGKIKSYRKNSQPANVIDMGNYFAESFCVSDEYVFSSSVYSTGLQRSIQVFYIQSGVLKQGLVSSLETKRMFMRNSSEIILFGNETGTGKIKVYDANNNSISEPVIFSGGIIYDAIQVSSDIYYIAHSGGIHRLNMALLSEVSILSGTAYQKAKYESISGQFYFASGNTLQIFNGSMNLINTAVASDSIMEIEFLYNK